MDTPSNEVDTCWYELTAHAEKKCPCERAQLIGVTGVAAEAIFPLPFIGPDVVL